jgi:bifunctional non-homologous end joining protein LigD
MLWRPSAPARRPEGFIEPCLPTLGHTVPSGPQWAYEIKHDGFPFICRRGGDRVRVFSRRGNDYTDRVPRIAKALATLRVKSVTLDGEGVVCREDGVSHGSSVAADPVIPARLASIGQIMELGGPAEFAARIDDQRATLAAIAKSLGRKPAP